MDGKRAANAASAGAGGAGIVVWLEGNNISSIDWAFDTFANQETKDQAAQLGGDLECVNAYAEGDFIPTPCPPDGEIVSTALAHLGVRPPEGTPPTPQRVATELNDGINQLRDEAVETKTDVIGSVLIGAAMVYTGIRTWLHFRGRGRERAPEQADSAPQPVEPQAPQAPRRGRVLGGSPRPQGNNPPATP